MKIVVCFALVAMVAASPLDLNRSWELWKTTHEKVYTPEEEMVRKIIWQSNMKTIQRHNADYQNGKTSFKMAMNQFGDMETHEFKNLMNGYRPSQRSKGSTYVPPSNVVLPDHVDWRDKGYVTPVKNQGACGSCWAFSTTGSLEGQTFKKTGKLISLSEQQLVDCSRDYGNMGCGGGWMDHAFNYIKDYGEESEDDYPYTAKDDPCTYSASKVVAEDTGHTDILPENEDDLQNALATVGPVSVAIDAGHQSFQFYTSGVYDEPACSQTILDHGVLAVGYGATEDGQQYYIVKNSWDVTWGNEGYIWMSRNKDNQCGIATNASYPLV